MNSQRNAKGRIFLSLVLALLLCAAGCQAESGSAGVWLAGDSLSQLEALYGQSLDAVREAQGLSEEDLREMESPVSGAMWEYAEPEKLEGKDFQKILLFDVNTGGLYGLRYAYTGTAEEGLALLDALYPQAEKAFGEPDTYPDHPYRYATEEGRAAMENAQPGEEWTETWNLSENTSCDLTWQPLSEDSGSVLLTYAQPAAR